MDVYHSKELNMPECPKLNGSSAIAPAYCKVTLKMLEFKLESSNS